MKPILIGQAPGPKTDPDRPLCPWKKTSTGGRLANFMGINPVTYEMLFDRTNLLHTFPGRQKRDDRFPTRDARMAAQGMVPLLNNRRVYLIGRKVAQAFGVDYGFFDEYTQYKKDWYMFDVTVIPHPSGRNKFYHSSKGMKQSNEYWEREIMLLTKELEMSR